MHRLSSFAEALGGISQLHVQSWQAPSKSALSRYLAGLDTPPRFDVRRLIEQSIEAAAVSAQAAAAARVELADDINPNLRDVYGRFMSLPELLTQQLQFLGLRAAMPSQTTKSSAEPSQEAASSAHPSSSNKREIVESTPMDVEPVGAELAAAAADDSAADGSEVADEPEWPAYWLRLNDTLFLIIAGDGVRVTRHNKRQWTLIRFGLANLAVAQQSPLMWPLLAAIRCKEDDPVVGSCGVQLRFVQDCCLLADVLSDYAVAAELVLRFYNQQLQELTQSGLLLNGERVQVKCIPSGDLKFLAHAFKGQLGQSATHFDVTFSELISTQNKNVLRLDLLTREQSNSYSKRLADLQRFLDQRDVEAKRLKRELTSRDEAKIAAGCWRYSCHSRLSMTHFACVRDRTAHRADPRAARQLRRRPLRGLARRLALGRAAAARHRSRGAAARHQA